MDAILNLAGFIASHPLTRDRKLRAFSRLVRWQVESRLWGEMVDVLPQYSEYQARTDRQPFAPRGARLLGLGDGPRDAERGARGHRSGGPVT